MKNLNLMDYLEHLQWSFLNLVIKWTFHVLITHFLIFLIIVLIKYHSPQPTTSKNIIKWSH